MSRWGAPLATMLAVGAYLTVFRRFGMFDFADEGVQLMQAWRVVHGERPYLDFHTGYGPLYFAFQGALLGWGGLDAVRGALAVVHATSAALVFVLARRLAGTTLAWVAVAIQVAFFLPVAPALGAPFNVPYPAWYAELAGLAIATLLSGPRAFTAPTLAAAGVLVGATCAIKINSGLLLGAAVTLAFVLVPGDRRRGSRLVATLLALVALGAAALLGQAAAGRMGASLLPPVLALVALAAGRAAALNAAFVGFVAAAGVAAALWLGPLLVMLGPTRFAREALLIGSGVASIYETSVPVGLWLGAAAGLCGSIRGLASWRLAMGVGLATVVLAGALATGPASHPAVAVRLAAEAASFATAALVVWGGVRRLSGSAPRALVAPTAVAATGMLQLFPRPDGLHLMSIAPLVLPLAAHLWDQVVGNVGLAWRRAAVAFCLIACVVRGLPTLAVAAADWTGDTRPVPIGREVLWATPEGAPRLMAAATAVAAVAAAPASSGGVLSFPGCAAIPFFANRPPAGPHDYFFPGRPTRAEVAALVAGWRPAPPPLVVTCTAAGTDLVHSWSAYPEMTQFIATEYATIAAAPPFRVSEHTR